MSTEPAIACTLTEAEMPARRAQMAAIAPVVGGLVSALRGR
jgi:hypothetical protein